MLSREELTALVVAVVAAHELVRRFSRPAARAIKPLALHIWARMLRPERERLDNLETEVKVIKAVQGRD